MDHLKILKALIESQGNLSMQEIERMVKDYEAQINVMPVDEFYGLNPDQMQRILYSRLEQIDDVVKIRDSFDPTLLITACVARRATSLIRFVGNAGELILTKKGFLPRKIVYALKEIYLDFEKAYPENIISEFNEPEIYSLRQMIIYCGWLKVRNGRLSLTKIGKAIYDKGLGPKEYVMLLKVWMASFEWSRLDNFHDLTILQASVIFCLYRMHHYQKKYFSCEDMTLALINAFPTILEDEELRRRSYDSPPDYLSIVISTRLMTRFGMYFGLLQKDLRDVEQLEEPNRRGIIFRVMGPQVFRTTKLFDEVFEWVEQKRPVFPVNRPAGVTLH